MPLKTYNGFPGAFREKQARVLNKAFADGTATRPTSCEICRLSVTDGATIHAHNEDYHLPLEFVGVCYACHMGIHRRYQEPEIWQNWLAAVAMGFPPPRTRQYADFIKAWFSISKKDYPPVNSPGNLLIPQWAIGLSLIELDLYTR